MPMRLNRLCPYCGFFHDFSTPTNEQAPVMPEHGDAALCVECGAFSRFVIDNGVATLRRSTMDEVADDLASDECRKAKRAWLAAVLSSPRASHSPGTWAGKVQ